MALATLLPMLDEQLRGLEEIARSTVSVILRGETGTGKEVTARAVHQLSGRSGELIAVNCGALPATLLEGLLFGYRKGAFSGATEDHPGLVRAADRGTLFLDEVGDLPQLSQAALLRVLQEQEVTPLGATRPIKVDLRVICATHRDLEAQVARDQFRADLYARLSGHIFTIPPLRERREDLGLLTAALLRRIAPDRDVRFEPETVRALCRYDWPHNVRELEKCLESAVVRARGELTRRGGVALEHLPAVLVPPAPVASASSADRKDPLKEKLLALLRVHHGNVSAVAREMNKARNQVYRWLDEYGIDRESYREP